MSNTVESIHFDYISSEEITWELQIVWMTEFVEQHSRNWEKHIDRRSFDGISKIL